MEVDGVMWGFARSRELVQALIEGAQAETKLRTLQGELAVLQVSANALEKSALDLLRRNKDGWLKRMLRRPLRVW